MRTPTVLSMRDADFQQQCCEVSSVFNTCTQDAQHLWVSVEVPRKTANSFESLLQKGLMKSVAYFWHAFALLHCLRYKKASLT
mmetsp:Transcript_26295/g.47711  ORF Transcript_26295/g.47711 Transcript_26295/m.47711 type:complete len:83 (+) Transcript_26295:237-485(+)